MTVNCLWCGQYVEFSNVRWPGFCSPGCRNADRQRRQDEQDLRRQVRAAARDKVDADRGRWDG